MITQMVQSLILLLMSPFQSADGDGDVHVLRDRVRGLLLLHQAETEDVQMQSLLGSGIK
jgi:two-component sensor histidine kinase